MASPYSTPSHTVIVTPYANEEPMPAGATGTLFLLASGFGIGALVILFAFVFLIGIGGVGHIATSGPTAAQQSAATAPAAPGPRPIRRRTRAAARCRKRQVRRPHRPIPARRARQPRDRSKLSAVTTKNREKQSGQIPEPGAPRYVTLAFDRRRSTVPKRASLRDGGLPS